MERLLEENKEMVEVNLKLPGFTTALFQRKPGKVKDAEDKL